MCCARVLSMLVMLTLLWQRHGMIQYLALTRFSLARSWEAMFFREHPSSTHPLPLEQHSSVQGVGATAHFGFRLAETSIDPALNQGSVPNREEANFGM